MTVVKGTISIGDKLPSENDLARSFGVSRPVVREAIGTLRAWGIVESKNGSGTFITAVYYPSPNEIFTVLQQGDHFDKQEQKFSVVPIGPTSLLTVDLDVELEPAPPEDELRQLLAQAERDCFVGASLTVKPTYRWSVNGSALLPPGALAELTWPWPTWPCARCPAPAPPPSSSTPPASTPPTSPTPPAASSPRVLGHLLAFDGGQHGGRAGGPAG